MLAAPEMVSFFTAGSWEKDTIFGAASNFASLDTIGGPEGVRIVEWNQNQLLLSVVFITLVSKCYDDMI